MVESLLTSAVSTSTQQTYSRAFHLLHEFVQTSLQGINCLPTSVDTLVYFIAHLFSKHFAAATIKTYVAGIGYINQLAGFSDPANSFLIKKILVAVQRGSYQPDSRLPITPSILRRLVQALAHTNLSYFQQILLKAMYLLAFHAFLRVGEMISGNGSSHALQYEDLRLVSDHSSITRLEITFHSYKGNYNIRPVVISIDRKQDTSICPVLALEQYIRLRGTTPGPLFRLAPNIPISYHFFGICMKQTVIAAGLPPNSYSSHSFRIGAASSAAAAGIPDEEIQQMGRWRSLAFKRYIRLPTFYDN